MALKFVTGKTGVTHVTSDDEAAFNVGIMGAKSYVFTAGNQLKATVLSSNSVKIADGDAAIQGKMWRITPNSYETVTIENGQTGYNRNDIIAAKYTRTTAGIENIELTILKGTATTGTASDAVYSEGDMRNADAVIYQPLYRVSINGLSISSLTPLFTVVKDYQQLSTDETTRAKTAEQNILDKLTNIFQDKIYPVGSPFISFTDSRNPNVILGFGTWTQIKDSFLLAAGDTYGAGSTGGEAEHTLTINEMPSHNHAQVVTSGSGGTGTRKDYAGDGTNLGKYPQGVTTGNTGGGGAHNNMPPYLAVYMWQRTA